LTWIDLTLGSSQVTKNGGLPFISQVSQIENDNFFIFHLVIVSHELIWLMNGRPWHDYDSEFKSSQEKIWWPKSSQVQKIRVRKAHDNILLFYSILILWLIYIRNPLEHFHHRFECPACSRRLPSLCRESCRGRRCLRSVISIPFNTLVDVSDLEINVILYFLTLTFTTGWG
jgi:hypothetical protein